MKLLVLKPLNKMGLMNGNTSETARASFLGAHVARFSWDEAVVSVVYLVNQMPSKVLDFQTPLQALSRFALLPFILMLSPLAFECVAFVHFHKNQCTKLDPCAVHYVFMGYEAHQKGYWYQHPSTRRTYVIMDVTFIEYEMYYSFVNPTLIFRGTQEVKSILGQIFRWNKICSTAITRHDRWPLIYDMTPKLDREPLPSTIGRDVWRPIGVEASSLYLLQI